MKLAPPSKYKFLSLIALLFVLFSCKKEEEKFNLPISGPDQAFFILSENSIYSLNAKDVKTLINKVPITGLSPDEKMLSIDFRPATGELYGISTANKIYIIDSYGTTRPLSTSAFTPGIPANAIVSLDFIPTTDKIRIVTSAGQNLRLDPETGLVISTDATINENNSINGLSHTNAYSGASQTILYDIDLKTNKLYKQDIGTNGQLAAVGDLEIQLGENISFEIPLNEANALAIGHKGDSTNLYTINLSTGKGTIAGRFPAKTKIQGIAIAPPSVAYAINSQNELIIFAPNSENFITKPITGMQANEKPLAIDFRLINGRMYALGSSNRLYSVDLGTAKFSAIGNTFSTALDGQSFSLDINPVTDRIKVISNTGQNLLINPTDATVTTETAINSGNKITGMAYNNNFRGAVISSLYGLDITNKKLFQINPTTGELSNNEDINLTISNVGGFDIISNKYTSLGFGIFTVNNEVGLYQINLVNGEAQFINKLNFTANSFTLGLR